MINWTVFAINLLRTLLYVLAVVIVVALPGRLGDVPYRRGLAFAASAIGVVSSTFFTLVNSGIWTATSNLLVWGGVLSGLVVALWTAIVITSAYGPRPWER